MNLQKFLFSLAVALTCLSACRTEKPNTAEDLVRRLAEAAQQGKMLYGHQDDLVYGHSWKVESDGDAFARSDVQSVCGAYPAVVGFDLGGIELGNEKNLDGVPFAWMRKAVQVHTARGGVVTFSWHPRNPLTGGDAWDVSDSTVVRSVLEGGACAPLFQQWLGRAAAFLKTLDGIPVIFRPWHEHMGSWFWWGRNLCSDEEYVALFRYTVRFMQNAGVKNLVWAFSPNSEVTAEEYMSRYPGDDCVDIMGLDHYEGTYVPDPDAYYVEILRRDLAWLTPLAASHGKVVALTETGYEGIPNPRWWTDCLLAGVADYPVAYALTWRNAHDRPGHFYAPYPGSADSKNFLEFYHNEHTVFLP
ncbi:MAG: beta-mannosidase [Bacteroidales bacterium]|nr:beta-mannosidase [Bacteroidales bacterium]